MTGISAPDAKAKSLSTPHTRTATNAKVMTSERMVSPLAIVFFCVSENSIMSLRLYHILPSHGKDLLAHAARRYLELVGLH